MNRFEHLLVITAEECSELAQETAKALRFGIFEMRDLPTTNLERMQVEYNQLLAMVDMINDELSIASITDGLYRDEGIIEEKRAKVEKYLLYSKKCGTLTG